MFVGYPAHLNFSEKYNFSQEIAKNFKIIQENPFLHFLFSANFLFGAKFGEEI
jgi:hypothetical protein